jgi:8-oxo-dGTP pyrophosphatase MutT (NUDIX family)
MERVRQAGAIVVREHEGGTQVLLVRAKQDPSRWIFPKGHIDPGESAPEAAARELREEAGVVGRVIRPVGVLRFPSGAEQVEVTYYLARFGGFAPTSEVRSSEWLSLEEAKQRLSFGDARDLLDKAVRVLRDKSEG